MARATQAISSAWKSSSAIPHTEGDFLIRQPQPAEIFTPEDFTEEHRLVAEQARLFHEREIAPVVETLEDHDTALLRRLLEKASEVGFVATGIPEADGGLGIEPVPAMLELEQFGRYCSFAITLATQNGIGVLPLVFFGTPDIKARYLPGIISGRTICAFALTEAQSGSDAMTARTTARLDRSGRYYLLNGEKMWVTNAGIADLFTVFARVDAKHFTAFLVEKSYPGVSLGTEESKMGMRGSSTCPLILQEVAVPVENVLGEVGAGHRVAFGTLNISRARMGAGLAGSSKAVLSLAARYARERIAFGRPIAQFGLIQQKLANMTAFIYALESMAYRVAGLLAPNLAKVAVSGIDSIPDGLGFAAECSILKVFGSETYDYVADEGVQIHGGYGYSSEYPIERHYRDARVNRIFEGTNEIHRLLIADRLIKLAASGQLPLGETAASIRTDLARKRRGDALHSKKPGVPASDINLAERAKKIAVLMLAAAAQQFGRQLAEKQVLVGALSDICIEAFAIESAVGRTLKAVSAASAGTAGRRNGSSPAADASSNESISGASLSPHSAFRIDVTSLFVADAFERLRASARMAAGMIGAGDSEKRLERFANELLTVPLIDHGSLCERIAASVCDAGGYIF